MVEGCIQQNAFDSFRQNVTFFIESLVFSFSRKWDILNIDSVGVPQNYSTRIPIPGEKEREYER